MPKRTVQERNHRKARMLIRAKLLEWYVDASGGRMPEYQIEDKKLGGTIIWTLDPPIPGIRNFVLIEEYIGDSWSMKTVERLVPIRVFT
jgi:hypothetical protein